MLGGKKSGFLEGPYILRGRIFIMQRKNFITALVLACVAVGSFSLIILNKII